MISSTSLSCENMMTAFYPIVEAQPIKQLAEIIEINIGIGDSEQNSF